MIEDIADIKTVSYNPTLVYRFFKQGVLLQKNSVAILRQQSVVPILLREVNLNPLAQTKEPWQFTGFGFESVGSVSLNHLVVTVYIISMDIKQDWYGGC